MHRKILECDKNRRRPKRERKRKNGKCREERKLGWIRQQGKGEGQRIIGDIFSAT